MIEWRDVRLRRVFERPIGGTWGSDVGEADLDVACIRGTDFDMTTLRVDEARLPVRSVTKPDWKKRHLQSGDVVIEKSGGGEQQPVGRAALFDLDRAAVPTNFAARLRPTTGSDPRFLTYLLNSCYASGTTRSAIKQTTGIQNLDLDAFLSERVRVPNQAVQREVADFLDAETERIVALIEKKRRMTTLVGERAQIVAEEVLWSNVHREIPLMHSVQLHRPVMYGIVLPGPDVGESGIPIVKGGDVGAGPTLDRLARTTPEIERPYARARLRPGDLLFAIRGGVGDAAIVPPELEGANITQDVARVAPATGVASEWLLHVLRSGTFQRRAGELVRGATITGLNIRDLERIRIPWVDGTRQDADLAVIHPLAAVSAGVAHRLERQIDLLSEHRQALITAAVTGQLEVAKAAA